MRLRPADGTRFLTADLVTGVRTVRVVVAAPFLRHALGAAGAGEMLRAAGHLTRAVALITAVQTVHLVITQPGEGDARCRVASVTRKPAIAHCL